LVSFRNIFAGAADAHQMHLDGSRNRADATLTKTGPPGIRFCHSRSSHLLRDPASGRYERENHAPDQYSVQTREVVSPTPHRNSTDPTSPLATVALGKAARFRLKTQQAA
jgi:hypothetical protein